MDGDNFTPNTAFEGFVYANLENVSKDIKTLKEDVLGRLKELPCNESSKRINDVEKKVANIEGKAGVIGAVAGFVTAFVTKYILGK